jgi:hypothetical protein
MLKLLKQRKKGSPFLRRLSIIICILLLLFLGCELDKELDKCESKIDRKINELETSLKEECLTKEDVIEILISIGYDVEYIE